MHLEENLFAKINFDCVPLKRDTSIFCCFPTHSLNAGKTYEKYGLPHTLREVNLGIRKSGKIMFEMFLLPVFEQNNFERDVAF